MYNSIQIKGKSTLEAHLSNCRPHVFNRPEHRLLNRVAVPLLLQSSYSIKWFYAQNQFVDPHFVINYTNFIQGNIKKDWVLWLAVVTQLGLTISHYYTENLSYMRRVLIFGPFQWDGLQLMLSCWSGIWWTQVSCCIHFQVVI